MFCYKCGTQLPDDANVCSQCGQVLAENQPQQTNYQPPIQQYSNQTYQDSAPQAPDKKKKGIGCLIAALIPITVFVIVAIIVGAIMSSEDTGDSNVNTTTSDSANSNTEQENNSNLIGDSKKIAEATGMDDKSAQEAYEAFKSVSNGISVIYSVSYDELLDDIYIDGVKGYRIETEFSKNVIMYIKDGKLHSIRYLDYDYYIDGKVNGYFYDRSGNLIAGQPVPH